MRQRLKKKLHKGPFKEYGFEVSGKLRENVDCDKLLDDFIDFIVRNDMCCAGGFRPDGFGFFIQAGKKKDKPEERRESVISWLDNNSDIFSCKAEDLIDAFYPPEEMME